MIFLSKENFNNLKISNLVYPKYHRNLFFENTVISFLNHFKNKLKTTTLSNMSKYKNIFNVGALYINNYKQLINLNNKKFNILIMKMYKLKLNLVIINKNECKLNLTPGVVLKKLNLKEKKMKKDIKILNYMIKITFNRLDLFFKKTNYLINFIGLGKNYDKILKFLKKNTKIKKNLFLVNVNRNFNTKKIKKIKSIKKNIKKKIIKL